MNTHIPSKILIVTQELIIGVDLLIQLKKHKYEVIGINNTSNDALNSILIEGPDLILIDIGFNGSIDGIALAKIIKSKYEIPVIFLNPGVNRKVMHQAVLSKPDAFLHIPYEIVNLKKQISRISKHGAKVLEFHPSRQY